MRHGTTDRWVTPPEVFDQLRAEFDFDLDAAADDGTYRVRPFLTDALNQPWIGSRVWLNPPYGKAIGDFVRKAASEGERRVVVALLPMRCCAAWWHEAVIGRAAELRFVKGRVHFLTANGERPFRGTMQGSVVVVWRPRSRTCAVSTFTQEARRG